MIIARASERGFTPRSTAHLFKRDARYFESRRDLYLGSRAGKISMDDHVAYANDRLMRVWRVVGF